MEMIKVLFVCTGNICRSPTAEGVFRARIKAQGLDGKITTDSAGTENYHVGDPPDRRSINAAKTRKYNIEDLRARQVRTADFSTFDLILAMDSGHYRTLLRSCPPDRQSRVRLFLDFSSRYPGQDVPDPYYGEADGFNTVLDMVEDGSKGLLAHIQQTYF